MIDSTRGKDLPGVLLVHEFMGIGDYLLPHAEALAAEGYAVFMCDMYGADIRPGDSHEASHVARTYREDRQLMRHRGRAGLEKLSELPGVAPQSLLALGFSFGGCAVLELARSGADILGAASFYGYLDTPRPCAPGDVKAKLLVIHGVRDTVVSMTEVTDFADEMQNAQADCRIILHTAAGHGFSNETLGIDPVAPSAYCPVTAQRAWKSLLDFYSELTCHKK